MHFPSISYQENRQKIIEFDIFLLKTFIENNDN